MALSAELVILFLALMMT